MSIFRDFFAVKQKPIFTGSRFGFGSSGAPAPEPPKGLEATGGGVSAPGDGYKYHVFTTPGTFTVDSVTNAGTFEVCLVGGGGGGRHGGDSAGGGGGAGGLVYRHSIPATAGNSFPIVIGAGGAGSNTNSGGPGDQGGDTTGFSLTALGGGAGTGRYGGPSPTVNATPGGSGGSAANFGFGRATGIQPAQNPGVPNLTQYGNPGYINGDSSPYMYSDSTGGSSNLNNEGSPAFGQIPSAQLPFPGQPGGSTILSGAPWGASRQIALGGFYVPSPSSPNIRSGAVYGCGGHGTPANNTGGHAGVCVVRYVPA
jgi:hypothetical protein